MRATTGRTYRNGASHVPLDDPPRKPSWLLGLAKGLGYFYAVREAAGDYLAAQADRLRVRSQRTLREAEKKILGLIAVAVLMTAAIVLAVRGIAGGLAEALGGRVWAGDLITAGILGLSGLTAWMIVRTGRPAPPHSRDEFDDPC